MSNEATSHSQAPPSERLAIVHPHWFEYALKLNLMLREADKLSRIDLPSCRELTLGDKDKILRILDQANSAESKEIQLLILSVIQDYLPIEPFRILRNGKVQIGFFITQMDILNESLK